MVVVTGMVSVVVVTGIILSIDVVISFVVFDDGRSTRSVVRKRSFISDQDVGRDIAGTSILSVVVVTG